MTLAERLATCLQHVAAHAALEDSGVLGGWATMCKAVALNERSHAEYKCAVVNSLVPLVVQACDISVITIDILVIAAY